MRTAWSLRKHRPAEQELPDAVQSLRTGGPTRQLGARIWRRSTDLSVVGAGAVLLLGMVWLDGVGTLLTSIRLVLGLLYVLFVPGYCLSAALFPRAGDLDTVERVGLSVGLSVAVAPVMALILSATPWGLFPWPIFVSVYVFCAVALLIALWRRLHVTDVEVYRPSTFLPGLPHRIGGVSIGKRQLMFGGLLAVVCLALGLWIGTSTMAEFQARSSTTEFYVLSSVGLVEGYPSEVSVGRPIELLVGISNQDSAVRSYSIEVWAPGPPGSAQPTLVASRGPVTLSTAESREFLLRWQMPAVGDRQPVDMLLFMENGSDPIRRLRLWIDVGDARGETERSSDR